MLPRCAVRLRVGDLWMVAILAMQRSRHKNKSEFIREASALAAERSIPLEQLL